MGDAHAQLGSHELAATCDPLVSPESPHRYQFASSGLVRGDDDSSTTFNAHHFQTEGHMASS